MSLKLRLIAVLLVAINCLIFPPPVHETYKAQHLKLTHVCNLFQSPTNMDDINSQYYLSKVLKRINGNSECPRSLTFKQDIHTLLTAVPGFNMPAQSYEIDVNAAGIKIKYADYSGYVYALESLSQIIKDNKIPHAIIKDEPLLEYRGIMIDSARHFLSTAAIKRVIEAMPLSKLNILHWHIVDDESFPIKLGSHPELSQYGKYSSKQIYTVDDVKELIRVAGLNAVKIVPEIDTPAHVRSWGLAPEWKNASIKCAGGTGYNGQFDVSKAEVYELAKDVVKEVDALFKDSPYIHLGGDEVSSACWNLRPEIKTFMATKGIKSYGELQMYWRYQLKQVLPASRKVIFWRNDGTDVTTSDTDILHFWGAQTDVAKITADSKSKIILSPSDILYISKGMGNLWLNGTQGNYSNWRQIYENLVIFPAGVDQSRILGAEVCLWGEVSNEDTLENNLWMRSTSFAGRVWSSKILKTHEVVANLVAIQYALYDMNVDASPVTSEFCERKPALCWPPQKPQEYIVEEEEFLNIVAE